MDVKLTQSNTYNQSIIRCQAFIRRRLAQQKYRDLKAQSRIRSDRLINDETFYGENVVKIPDKYFYILEENEQLYAFDLREIWEWIFRFKKSTNPFTNNQLSKFVIKQVQRLYERQIMNSNLNEDLNENLNEKPNKDNLNQNPKKNNSNKNLIKDNTNTNSNFETNYNAILTDFFIKLESNGCYVNIEGYKKLTVDHLWNLFYDIYTNYQLYQKNIPSELITELSQYMKNKEEKLFKLKLLQIFELVLDKAEDPISICLIFADNLSKFLSNNGIYSTNVEYQESLLSTLFNLDLIIQNIIDNNTFSITQSNSDTDSSIDDSEEDLDLINDI